MSSDSEANNMDYMDGFDDSRKPTMAATGNNANGNSGDVKNGDGAPPAAKRNKVWIKLLTYY